MRQQKEAIQKGDIMFIPKTLKSLASEVSVGVKTIGGSIVSNVSSDFKTVRENRGKGGINNFYLGMEYMRESSITLAIFRLWLATKFCPGSPSAYFNLGRCYIIAGNLKKAVYNIKIALFLRPSIKGRVKKLMEEIKITYPDISSALSTAKGKITAEDEATIRIAIFKAKKRSAILMVFDKIADFVFFTEKISQTASKTLINWHNNKIDAKLAKKRAKKDKIKRK